MVYPPPPTGNVDLRVASRLYGDLVRAQAALAVINQLHLLYLVTPYDMMDAIQPCAGAYLDMVSDGGAGNGGDGIVLSDDTTNSYLTSSPMWYSIYRWTQTRQLYLGLRCFNVLTRPLLSCVLQYTSLDPDGV